MVIAGLLGITGDGAAQPSAECGPGPCIQVGLEDAAHGSTEIANAADHFVYCPEGETVELDFLAVFTSGTSCDTTCPHPNRTLQWTVSGATSSQITTYPTSIPEQHTYLSEVQITLAEAGDTITVTCTVGDTNANQECEEDDPRKEYEHGGSHAGASASCTVKLWRMELEADADLHPTLGHPFYKCEFANNITTTATVVGSVGTEYRWQSRIDDSLHAEVINTSTSWAGELVAQPTYIYCQAEVINQCDPPNGFEYREESVIIDASIRRPEWTTEVQLVGTDDHWLSDDPNAFPQVDWSLQIDGTLPSYGRLANARIPYDKNYTAAVVPI